MKIRLASTAAVSRLTRSRKPLAILGAAAAAATALLAGSAGPASASPYWVTLTANSDGLALDVSGASTSAGAPVIQWWVNGGANQHWHFDAPDGQNSTWIVNQNSGMCLTTDGVEGDQLYQAPCTDGNGGQVWIASNYGGSWRFESGGGLAVDVYGYSPWAGGSIDAWEITPWANQQFTATAA